MSIAEKLQASKDALDALLTYANDATSAGDTDIGEAIRTLVDGYGKGGGGKVFTTTFTPTSNVTNTGAIYHNLGTTDVTVFAYLLNPNGIDKGSTNGYYALSYMYSNRVEVANYMLADGKSPVQVGKKAVYICAPFAATATTADSYFGAPYAGAENENFVNLHNYGSWKAGWTYRIIVFDNSILDSTGGGSGVEWNTFAPAEGTTNSVAFRDAWCPKEAGHTYLLLCNEDIENMVDREPLYMVVDCRGVRGYTGVYYRKGGNQGYPITASYDCNAIVGHTYRWIDTTDIK